MKFARILRSELVPEWKKQYINYKYLKRLLKPIKKSIGENSDTSDSNRSDEVSISIPQPTVDVQQLKRRPNTSLPRQNSLLFRMSSHFTHSTRKRTDSRSVFTFYFVKKKIIPLIQVLITILK